MCVCVCVVPCVSGTFLNKDHRGRPVCTSCPKGFYKDDEYATHCTQCPVGKSTVDRGSTLSADCIGRFYLLLPYMSYKIFCNDYEIQFLIVLRNCRL